VLTAVRGGGYLLWLIHTRPTGEAAVDHRIEYTRCKQWGGFASPAGRRLIF